MIKEIGIVGDFHNSKTQVAIANSIDHSNRLLGLSTKYRWIDTMVLAENNYCEELKMLSGIWSASGSPFKSIQGSLNAIKYARKNNIPHIGTCGGYQHTIIEYARNVLGIENANHAEYKEGFDNLIIDKMTCSLVGTRGKVNIKPNTFTSDILQSNWIEVDYYCSYGLSDKYVDVLLKDDLISSGFDVNGATRIVELKNHPFFIISAFVPQTDSTFENPNRLVSEFIKHVNSI